MVAKLAVVSVTANGPLGALVEDYLASCKARGLSPNTLQNSYGYPLRKVLLPYCEKERITELADLTSRALERLAGHLMDEGRPRGPLSRHSVHAGEQAVGSVIESLRVRANARGTRTARRQPADQPHREPSPLSNDLSRAGRPNRPAQARCLVHYR